MGKVDSSGAKACNAHVKGNVAIGPETKVAPCGSIPNMPLGIALGATEVADPVEKAEQSAQQSHGKCVSVRLCPVVQCMDRSRCGFTQKDDGEQTKAFAQMLGVGWRTVGLARNEEGRDNIKRQCEDPERGAKRRFGPD